MTFKYNNVYVKDTATVVGPLEGKGKLSSYFDKIYNDYYFSCDSIEQAEVKLFNDSVETWLFHE